MLLSKQITIVLNFLWGQQKIIFRVTIELIINLSVWFNYGDS